jgi:hypothetical protein
MVQEPSHVKQLSPIHVCKIGLSIEIFANLQMGAKKIHSVFKHAFLSPCKYTNRYKHYLSPCF